MADPGRRHAGYVAAVGGPTRGGGARDALLARGRADAALRPIGQARHGASVGAGPERACLERAAGPGWRRCLVWGVGRGAVL
eukprot:2926328-Alexandrium_andersonii.AAC.1